MTWIVFGFASWTPTILPAGSSSVAAKLRYCSCGKRMSTLTYDFHSVCVSCRGIDCDFEHRCDECANIADDDMTVYVRHRRSLLSEQHSKSKQKDLLLSAVDDPMIVGDPDSCVELPPVLLEPHSVPEDFQSTGDAKLSCFEK